MIVLGIDPGTRESGYVLLDSKAPRVLAHGVAPNPKVLDFLGSMTAHIADAVVLEMVGHYGVGMPAGKDVFHTCLWIGLFLSAIGTERSKLVLRPTVKAVLCGSAKAKDANVAQAVRDYFGGDELAVGGKKCSACKGSGATGRGKARSTCLSCLGSTWAIPPGPFHEIRSHEWQALGAIVAYLKEAKTIEAELFPSSAGDTAPTQDPNSSRPAVVIVPDVQSVSHRLPEAVSPAEAGSLRKDKSDA